MKHLKSYTLLLSLFLVFAFVLEVVAGPGFSGRSGGTSFSSGRSSSFSSGRPSYSSPSYSSSRPSYSSSSYTTSKPASSGSSWFTPSSSNSNSGRKDYFGSVAKSREVAAPASSSGSYSTGYKKELPVQNVRRNNTYSSDRGTYTPTNTRNTTTREVHHYNNNNSGGFVDDMLKWTMISSLMHRQPQVVVASPAVVSGAPGNPAVVTDPGVYQPAPVADNSHGFFYYMFIVLIGFLIAFLLWKFIIRVKEGE